MSNLAVQGGAGGTGTVTLLAPSTSTDRTLTLPDSTGTVLNDQSNIEAQVKTATNASGSAPVYACRAWVNFNGTGTVAIRSSGNVSSITDGGVGIYTINFATAMPDANYAVTGVCTGPGSSTMGVKIHSGTSGGAATQMSTSSVQIGVGLSGASTDSDSVTVAIHR